VWGKGRIMHVLGGCMRKTLKLTNIEKPLNEVDSSGCLVLDG